MLSLYRLKKMLLYPYTAYKRRSESVEPGFIRSSLETHYYRPAFYRWLGAVHAQPDLLHQANLGRESIVLDVGAYFGEWCEEMSARYAPQIFAFEPDPINFERLEQICQTNPAITPMQYGLSDRNETARMSLEFMGSTIYTNGKVGNRGRWAEVEIRDIRDVWRELQLDRVQLMKINIEGGEFPLLERMIETGLTDQVDTFLIQFHEWHPGAYRRRRKIQRELARTHRAVWDYHFIWEKWERL